MERLTTHALNTGNPIVDCDACQKAGVSCHVYACRNILKDRLAAIEDILGDTYDLEWLRGLVDAERQGRTQTFPCSIGTTVFTTGDWDGDKFVYNEIHTGIVTGFELVQRNGAPQWIAWLNLEGNHKNARTGFLLSEFGESWFLTREKAINAWFR